MREIKKGDAVTRYSYNNDIIFYVKKILYLSNNRKIAILKGMNIRVEADAPIEDLRLASKEEQKRNEILLDKKIKSKEIKEERYKRKKEIVKTGKILHLDGDKKYSQKSLMYYQKMRLNAVVKNIPEYKQPKAVYRLLQIYNPDIIVITRS